MPFLVTLRAYSMYAFCAVLKTIVDEITLLIYVSFVFDFYWQFRHTETTQ